MAVMKKRPIDGQKFKQEILKRYRTQVAANEALGYADAISNWINRGEVPEYAVYLIEEKLGIKYDDIKPVEERKPADKMGLNGRPCHFCQGDETVFPIDITEGKLNIALAIMPRRKVMEITANFGNEPVFSGEEDATTMFHFCPYCGREL